MDINVITLLNIVGSLCGLAIMFYVIPKQIKEVRRPKNEYTRLRWYLLAIPLIYSLALVLRLPRLLEILDHPHDNLAAALASLSGTAIVLSFALFVLLIYTYKEKG